MRQVLPLASSLGIRVCRPVPAERNLPAVSGSPIVAERPMRRGLTPASAPRRSSRQRVCPPRSPRRRECSSSITTKRRSWKSFGIAAWRCSSSASRDSGVICRIPEGRFISRSLWLCATSPCQCQTGISASAQSSLRRWNWSLMSALSGAMYRQPTEAGGSSEKSVMIGKKAASVLPEAVEAVSRRFSSVLKITSAAATWLARRFSQPLR